MKNHKTIYYHCGQDLNPSWKILPAIYGPQLSESGKLWSGVGSGAETSKGRSGFAPCWYHWHGLTRHYSHYTLKPDRSLQLTILFVATNALFARWWHLFLLLFFEVTCVGHTLRGEAQRKMGQSNANYEKSIFPWLCPGVYDSFRGKIQESWLCHSQLACVQEKFPGKLRYSTSTSDKRRGD